MWNERTVTAYVEDHAKHLPEKTRMEIVETIRCESSFVPDVQSFHITKNGTREESYGLAQINLPSWPSISKEQAIDPEFALDVIIEKFSEGLADRWPC